MGRYGTRTVEALQVGRDVLLPLSVVAELGEIRYRRVPPASAELVIEPGARRALSDPATMEIRFGDTTLALTPADRVVQAGEHYLSTRILGALLHTSFAVSWSDLSVTLLDADSLPVGRRRARERALAALRGGQGEAVPDLSLGFERVRWDGMVLDYSALMPATDLLGGGAYSANLGLNLFGGSFEAALASAGPARGGPPRLDASWTGVWRTGRWISQARIGDGLATGPRPRSVRGFSLTNAPFLRHSFFEDLPFAGALGPGWQIEAYRGGRLLALDSADALGRFSVDLPVEYGENPVDFVAYGPFGEIREFNRTYRVAGDALPARRFEYAVAAGGCRTPECTANANLDLRYGLSRRWSVRGGVDRFWRDTLPGLSHPYVGLSGSLGNAWGVNLEGVADAVVRTALRFEPTDDLRLTAEYDDFATATVAPLLTPLGRRNQWTFTAFARPIPGGTTCTSTPRWTGSRTRWGAAPAGGSVSLCSRPGCGSRPRSGSPGRRPPSPARAHHGRRSRSRHSPCLTPSWARCSAPSPPGPRGSWTSRAGSRWLPATCRGHWGRRSGWRPAPAGPAGRAPPSRCISPPSCRPSAPPRPSPAARSGRA